ncbi:MAG: epoxyqueuosine reductase QueH [Syntrophorhabdaceae bacterium]|nr:epoxyqueuosine reductase QueH [Syntrophorhabdaceae bacterium]
MGRILLHICCAPCTIYPLKVLRAEGYHVTGYFYNPNIQPYTEFQKRLETVEHYSKISLLEVIIDRGYDMEEFLHNALPLGKNRCLYCYRLRLERAFKKGLEEDVEGISTTLLYSKYQRHKEITSIGYELAEKYGVPFIYRDFREGWKEGVETSKRLNIYRQNYCGCIFSEKERYLKEGKKEVTGV